MSLFKRKSPRAGLPKSEGFTGGICDLAPIELRKTCDPYCQLCGGPDPGAPGHGAAPPAPGARVHGAAAPGAAIADAEDPDTRPYLWDLDHHAYDKNVGSSNCGCSDH